MNTRKGETRTKEGEEERDTKAKRKAVASMFEHTASSLAEGAKKPDK